MDGGGVGGPIGRAYRARNDYEAKLEQYEWERRRPTARPMSRRERLVGTAVFAVLITGALIGYAVAG